MTQAAFSISPKLLVVSFSDISTTDTGVTISSWSWDFGDSQSSTIQNPSNTFSLPGVYKVSLTVTDNTGGTSKAIRNIIVDSKPILPVSIEDLVKLKFPVGFPYSPEQITANIATWQLFLQPLVNAPGVLAADTYNEIAYPPIINALVGYIAAYQIMLDYVSGAAAEAAGAFTGTKDGVIKRIETGPANAEFVDPSNFLKYLTMPNGLMDQVKKQMCMLAFRSMINIPYCPPLPMPKFIPKKAGRHHHNHYVNQWNLIFSDIIIVY